MCLGIMVQPASKLHISSGFRLLVEYSTGVMLGYLMQSSFIFFPNLRPTVT